MPINVAWHIIIVPAIKTRTRVSGRIATESIGLVAPTRCLNVAAAARMAVLRLGVTRREYAERGQRPEKNCRFHAWYLLLPYGIHCPPGVAESLVFVNTLRQVDEPELRTCATRLPESLLRENRTNNSRTPLDERLQIAAIKVS